MSYTPKILPAARQDIKENIKWYNKRKKGLGKSFYEQVKARIAYIKQNPLHYQVKYRTLRHAQVNRFPYLVHYKVDEVNKMVIIFAVTYAGRDPEVWRKRG